MRILKPEDFDEAWTYFEKNKEWFPHVRKFHIRNRLNWGQVICEDGVLITQQVYARSGKIGHDTDVVTKKGDHLIHQIIAEKQGSGAASKVITKYFDYVKTDVWLTVRAANHRANVFYGKIGMSMVGHIYWSKHTMKGNVWKYEKQF